MTFGLLMILTISAMLITGWPHCFFFTRTLMAIVSGLSPFPESSPVLEPPLSQDVQCCRTTFVSATLLSLNLQCAATLLA